MARVEVEVEGRRLSLSNLDKVLYPETGTTKAEVIDYYARIAPVMVPHLADRGVTLRRFPDGISGDSIPIGSRIILTCDAYHAMTSDRPYRKAMSHEDALRELRKNAGTQFDPQVVEALMGCLYGDRTLAAPDAAAE